MRSNTQRHKYEIRIEHAEIQELEGDAGNYTTLQTKLKKFLHVLLVDKVDKLAYLVNAVTFINYFDDTKLLMKDDWPI